ncbi:MFS general substrate transporter [Fomitiporia mediterranea MF3/22]|uniref:MFS general substrate transporter n=1 Tax=Fomitiporia mediterranea (strain MF3/22) TaxID=694068 RepID=UPI0004409B9C|nr:MFS general substrate transporter [Fomitiporia mediterranea MF3/22]EJC98224.1 MFS general substrate transporter [Fomitiporia mediterranea MF3/22]
MSTTKSNTAFTKDGSETKHEAVVQEEHVVFHDNVIFNGEEKNQVVSDERRLVRKLDKRILPIVCAMYLFACTLRLVVPFQKSPLNNLGSFILTVLDRTNPGNARLQGLPEDVLHGDRTGTLYDWIFSSVYYKFPQLWRQSFSHLDYGSEWLVSDGEHSTGFNFTGLMLARICLGAFETGFSPGIPLYLSYFYTKREIGLRLAYYQSFAAASGALGGLIAFGIQHARATVASWRLLFIGIPSVLMGVIALFFLPDRPEMTRFFNDTERKIAMDRRNRAISSDNGFVINKSTHIFLSFPSSVGMLSGIDRLAHIWAALKDWRVYIGGVVYFGLNCAVTSISAFLPTIIKTFGVSDAVAQLLTVPPYAVAVVLLILMCYVSDRTQHRGLFLSAASALSAIGFLILLIVRTDKRVRYFAVFCITAGTHAAIGIILAWYAHNLGSETKRATGMPMFMTAGQCGSILGSHIFPSTEGPEYIKGFAVTGALELVSVLGTLILSYSYFSDNRRRDQLHGIPEPEERVDTSELADKISQGKSNTLGDFSLEPASGHGAINVFLRDQPDYCWPVGAHNLGSETKHATSIPLFMTICQYRSILGSQVFPSTEGPLCMRGFAVTRGLEFLTTFRAFVLSISYLIIVDVITSTENRPMRCTDHACLLAYTTRSLTAMSTTESNTGFAKGFETKEVAIIEEEIVAYHDNVVFNCDEKNQEVSDERRLVRKLDRCILPIPVNKLESLIMTVLDRANPGNARLQGLPEDVLHGDRTGTLYDWIFSSYFFSYGLFQIPAVVVSKLFPPRLWLGVAGIGCGICSTLMASLSFCRSTGFSFTGLMVARVFLGAFETGFSPAIPLYLSYFYTKREIGLRFAYYQSFPAASGAFGGLIAFGIQRARTTIASWRLLFIVEASYHFHLMSACIHDLWPEMTRFLSDTERKIAMERRNRATSSDDGFVINKSMHIFYSLASWVGMLSGIDRLAHIWAALKDWRVYIGGVVYFGFNCAVTSTSAFLPTIIKTFGVSDAVAQLLTVPPYAAAVVLLILTCYVSDRTQHRGLFLSATSALGAIGFLILLIVRMDNHVRYFAVFCITAGTYTAVGLILAWYAHNLGSETKRATGMPMIMTAGQCGAILGSHIFPSTEGPEYIKGFAVTGALGIVSVLGTLFLSYSYFLDNRRRNHLHGIPEPEERVDTSELADKAPMFRYMI